MRPFNVVERVARRVGTQGYSYATEPVSYANARKRAF